jgi:hypothetical protein
LNRACSDTENFRDRRKIEHVLAALLLCHLQSPSSGSNCLNSVCPARLPHSNRGG